MGKLFSTILYLGMAIVILPTVAFLLLEVKKQEAIDFAYDNLHHNSG